jgi:uncharacterized membrane protein
MTTGQMILMAGWYLVALVAVAYLDPRQGSPNRGSPSWRHRFRVVALLAVALGEAQNGGECRRPTLHTSGA